MCVKLNETSLCVSLSIKKFFWECSFFFGNLSIKKFVCILDKIRFWLPQNRKLRVQRF